jgi:hypothetical protein
MAHTDYPNEYYDEYFVSWGEVTAAARTTGMSERRTNGEPRDSTDAKQLRVLEKRETDDYLD